MDEIKENDIVECISTITEPDEDFYMKTVYSGDIYKVKKINRYFDTFRLFETGSADFPIKNFIKYNPSSNKGKCTHPSKYLSKWTTFEFMYCPDCKKEV